jgi:hypothetical protein
MAGVAPAEQPAERREQLVDVGALAHGAPVCAAWKSSVGTHGR